MTDIIVEITGVGGATNLVALTDVNTAGAIDSQVLTYDNATAKWIPSSVAGVTTIAALTDVNLTGVADGNVIKWDAGNSEFIVAADNDTGAVTSVAGRTGAVVIVKADIADFGTYATTAQGTLADSALQDVTGESIKDLSDVFTTMTPTDGQVLTFDTTNGWQAETASGAVTSVAGKTGVVTLVKADITDFTETDYATGAEGDLATSALQNITAEAIGSLSDVDLTGISNGFLLSWDETDGRFEPKDPLSLPSAPAATLGLNNLSDVTITTPATNSVLKYNGTFWIDDVVDYAEVTGTPTIIDWTTASQGTIDSTNLPGLALTDVNTVATEIAQLALVAQEGDVAIRTDLNKTYAHNGGVAATMADWSELLTPTDVVTSVAGKTGVVTLQKADITDLVEEDYAKPKVSATDTTTGYLEDKIVNGSGLGIELAKLNPGANEQLQINMESHYLAQASTGLFSGGELSVGVSVGTIDISAGDGLHVDSTTAFPTVDVTTVTISARTNLAITNIAIQPVTYILIDKNDVVIQQATYPTADEIRDNIFLGVAVHSDNTTVEIVNNLPSVALDSAAQTHDLMRAFGFFSLNGNVISPNGANLSINKSDGLAFKEGANFHTNPKDPHELSLAAQVAATFRYRNQDSSEGLDITLIDPTTYDNAGVTTTVPANNNATIQRVYIFPSNVIRIQRGQTVYANLSAAANAIGKEAFITEGNIAENGLLIASIAIVKTTTDLSNTSDALIFIASKFGELGSVGSSAVGTLQNVYDNSVTPEVIVEDVIGRGLTIKDSATNATRDNILEIHDTSDVEVFAVTRLGAKYDNTTSGLTADYIKEAIDETVVLANAALANVVEDTTPQLGGMLDVNGQSIGSGTLELLTFTETPSAVNQLHITNNITGETPILGVEGDDADINICLNPKGAGEVVVEKALIVNHTSQQADDHALEIIFDAAGFADAKALDIDYITGALASGDQAIMLVNIDETLATGGHIQALEILSTDGAADQISGLFAGAGVGPIHQESGTFANPTTGTNNTASVDVPAMIDGVLGTSTAVMVADNDYIIIGAAAEFTEIELIFNTPSSGDITPTFWYSTAGTGQFTQFTPTDGTNGFRNTGVIAWEASELTGHVADGVTGTYDIKIVRTKNNVVTTPILGYAKTASTIPYGWDKDGVVTIKDVVLSGLVDGRDVATDGTKLDTIETSATADQTGAEIKVAYELEADTNAFTDANVTTLSTALQSVVNDTSPQLGGDLDVNGFTIAGQNYYNPTVQTTDATVTTAQAISIAVGKTATFSLMGSGVEPATGDVYGFTLSGCISNNAGTTTIIGSNLLTKHQSAGATAWTITATANDTTDNLEIKVTGEIAHTINWNFTTRTVEV